MRRTVCLSALFCAILLAGAVICPASASAADTIDVSTAAEGYFTVSYGAQQTGKMKVGVTHGAGTVYYSYEPGGDSAYTFTEGDGAYTITLYRNISGTTYREVESARVDVELSDPMDPYLVSTAEITFSSGDAVGRKAAELCAGLSGDGDRVAAIYRFMAGSFTYDDEMGGQAKRGELVNYTPDTSRTLESGTGICYDFSALFAAMCRSQGIPCAIARGYLDGGYHAWNMVYVDGAWNAVDLTRAVSSRDTGAAGFADCVTSLDGYTGMTY